MKIIEKHIDQIKELCIKHNVSEMYAFGSVATNNLQKESDIDILVGFSKVDPLDYFDNYMDLKEKLEKLFSRNVDLVEIQTIKNPILKRSIDRNKIILYGREDSKMAV